MKNLLVSTWFSGLAGYEAALAEYWTRKMQPVEAERFWQDDTANVVHFLGYDCSYSHALVYPAISSLVHGNLPRIRHYTNAFLKLDNEDFSTSRNYAIWAQEFVSEHGVDPVRMFLAMKAPEQAPENFSLSEFITWKARFEQICQLLLDTDTSRVALSPFMTDNYQRWHRTVEAAGFSMRAYAGFIWDLCGAFLSCGDIRGRAERAALIAMLSAPLVPVLAERMMTDHLCALRANLTQGEAETTTRAAESECEAV